MKIHACEQGSVDWLLLRAGLVTASEFGNIVTNKFKAREGLMVGSYQAQLLAEKWQGGPLPSFGSFATEQGSFIEGSDAVPWFELEHGLTVDRVGFITDDAGRYGCSPDGIIHGEIGLEVKSPQAPNQVKYLLSGKVPEDYLPQIHFSMHVTGFKQWRFLSYRRGFPALVVAVERDEEIQEVIAESLAAFLESFDKSYARMLEINGGPPPRARVEAIKPSYTPDENDIIP